MSEIYVQWNQMSTQARQIGSIAAKMQRAQYRMNTAARELSSQNQTLAQVSRTVNALSSQVGENSRHVTGMSNGLSSISSLYKRTEQTIAGYRQTGSHSSGTGAKGNGNTVSADIPEWVYKMIIAAAGPVGLIIDGARRGAEGEWGKVISDLLKLAGGLAKNTDGSKINWAGLFKINPSVKGPWESAFGKFFDFSSLGKGISSACNWAAQIAVSAYSNFKEFGSLCARFWEETAAETLIKVGEGILITAGVGAAAVAAGLSLPGLAVAAIAVGVTCVVDFGLDALVSWATGGSQTSWVEAASDFICDTGEKIVNTVTDIGKKTIDTVKQGWNDLVHAVQGKGSSTKWGVMKFA